MYAVGRVVIQNVFLVLLTRPSTKLSLKESILTITAHDNRTDEKQRGNYQALHRISDDTWRMQSKTQRRARCQTVKLLVTDHCIDYLLIVETVQCFSRFNSSVQMMTKAPIYSK